MKKYMLLAGFLFSTTLANAQGQLGIKISPSISFNRVSTSPNNAGFASEGASLKFKLGVIYDYPIRDNYYLSTGLLFVSQQASIKNQKISNKVKEEHELQYLQLPVLLKLYTSEIALDTRLYVELGFIPQIKINDSVTSHEGEKPFIEAFRFWALGGVIGIGVEYDTSISTSLFAGISYQLGLASVIKSQQENQSIPKLACKNDLISIDLGVRF